MRDEIGEKLARQRANKEVSKDEILAMATLKMEYASEARAMEVSSLNSDGSMKDARDKMVQASRRVSQMEEDFDESVRDNPSIMVARRNLEDARVSVITAQTYADRRRRRRQQRGELCLLSPPQRYPAVGYGSGLRFALLVEVLIPSTARVFTDEPDARVGLFAAAI